MKLFIQADRCKFLTNLSLTKLPNIEIVSSLINNDIYAHYYRNKFNAAVFSADLVTSEVIQFIREYGSQLNLYLYHRISSTLSLVQDLRSICKHLHHGEPINKQCISIPALLNDQIFTTVQDSSHKENIIVGFLDNFNSIPNDLTKQLYPATTHRIQLFNGPTIKHYQNLGLVNESDRADLLRKAKYYLNLNTDYTLEALINKCIILQIQDLPDLSISNQSAVPEYKSYRQFIMETFI